MAPDFFLEALNISYEAGTITKEGGSAKYNASAITGTPSVIGGWDWWPDTSTQRMVVVTSGGKILKDSGTGTFPVELKSGLTVTNGMATFCDGGKEVAANNRKLFIFTGQNVVQVLAADGATTADITTPPADWSAANQPIAGCIHENRLWALGNLNDAHRVYYSTVSSHEDFTAAGSGSISVYPGEGEKLVGLISFKGYLIVWKFPVGVYLINTNSATVTDWTAQRLTQAVGMSGPLCATAIDNDVIYIDRDGNFQLLSATAEYGDLHSRNVSTLAVMSEFVRSQIALSQLHKTRAIYYPAKREAHFAIAASGATTNTRRIVLDFNTQADRENWAASDPLHSVPRFRFSDKDTCQSLWLRKDTNSIQRPTSGDNAGFVWNLDQATKSKDGAAYNARFQTAHDDLSRAAAELAGKRKIADFVELVFEPRGSSHFYIDLYWDGKFAQTIEFSTMQTGALFGVTKFGQGIFGSAKEIRSIRKRAVGSGRRVSFVGRNGNAAEDFSIGRLFFHFRPGDERD